MLYFHPRQRRRRGEEVELQALIVADIRSADEVRKATSKAACIWKKDLAACGDMPEAPKAS